MKFDEVCHVFDARGERAVVIDMPFKSLRILIAEDDDLSRQNLAEFLSDGGYEVVAVADGGAAMEEFTHDRYHLVITDLRMPRADGMEVLRFIKRMDPATLVVILTGYGSVDSAWRP